MRNGVLVLTAAALALLVHPGCSSPENRQQTDDSPQTKSNDSVSPTPTGQPDKTAADANATPPVTRKDPPKPKPPAPTPAKDAGNPIVIIETSEGTIRAELWKDKAPKTVANFMRYVDEGFYDGLIFHRVMKGFMIQGGGFTTNLVKKRPHAPIRNEASPALRNDRGTLAMARTGEIHSATAQFFINHANNDFLNQRDKTQDGFGYCAFGKVTEGMDVVDAIARVRTGARGPFRENVPVKNIVIKSIRRAK